jgi:hypothetical protein
MNLADRTHKFDLKGDSGGPNSQEIAAAIEKLSTSSGTKSRGAVFTRTEIVDFILDLVGYTSERPLYRDRLLEPSFGGGSFLFPVMSRLLKAWGDAKTSGAVLEELGDAIRAVELHRETYRTTHAAVVAFLKREGFTVRIAAALADRWLVQGDFLLTHLDGQFEFIVGNPPFVRPEMIPATLLAEYRGRYRTMYDRADIYIAFIERSLSMLSMGGSLGFICSDRWMKNRYGGPLRRLVAERFHLKIHVDMMNNPAFHSDVIAYPAVTVISRGAPGLTRTARPTGVDRCALGTLADALRSKRLPEGTTEPVRELACVTNCSEPWLLGSSGETALIRRIEQKYLSLEEAGCKVGIGVTTGADRVFIDDFDALDVEPSRKLPLVTTRDIRSGEVRWQGLGVVNPFGEDGSLVDLRDYPRLRHLMEKRREVLAARHCAKKSPADWYRTIDKITPALRMRPKLLVPDIKGEAHIVFEDGKFYPHHNLYYVISAAWELQALQAVMLSAVTRLFVAAYSTRMRGGCLRFQAQYLRRIRLPHWRSVPKPLRLELIDAATKRDMKACNRAVFKLYGLSSKELKAVWNE